MLIFVVGVVLLAYANVGLGLNGKIPAGMFEYGLAFAILVGLPPTWRCAGWRRTPTRSCCRWPPC